MKYQITALLLGLTLVAGGGWSHGGTYSANDFQSRKTNASSLTQNWTADVGPYKQALDRMKVEFEQGKNPRTISEEWKSIARTHPADPVAQLAYVAAQRGEVIAAGATVSVSLVNALATADPGNAYEYARYRFCLSDEANVEMPIKEVETVGNRLLNYNRMDNWVRISLINLLCDHTDGADEALPYAVEWVNQEPKDAKAHSALALVQFDRWQAGHKRNTAIARKALNEYRVFLRLAPPNDGFRNHAQTYIENIEKSIANSS